MKKSSLSSFAVALLVLGSVGCDTPPVSPATAGVPAIAPAHPSPDPPPARPLIVDDAGASRADAGALAIDGGGTDMGGTDDAGAFDGGLGVTSDGGTASATAATTVAGSDAVMTELRPKFRACYIRSGKINARPRGRLVFSARVAADGSVASVTSSQVQDIGARVVTCMTDVMKGAHFTAPGHPATVELPVSFQAP
jgi:hypothetical protein